MNRQNTIYYRFKSEKRKYTLTFEQTELSIGDIKKSIIKRRNMEKFPEKFELIILDEKSNDRFNDDNVKIEPLRTLLIERVPWYKLNKNSQFREILCDQTDFLHFRNNNVIDTRKIETHGNNLITSLRQYDPLEKIILKINFDNVKKQFSCKLCGKLDGEPTLTTCCGETACDSCIKNKLINEKYYCPFGCEVELNYLINLREKDLRERLIEMVNDFKLIEKNRNIKNTANTTISNVDLFARQNNLGLNNNSILSISNNLHPNLPNNFVNTNQSFANNTNNNVYSNTNFSTSKSVTNCPITNAISTNEINNNIISPSTDLAISQQYPHYRLFENTRFFIIKSSNRENVITSQTHNEWATTVANQKKLNDAFYQKDVVLIFSVNKSGFFQGYAAMASFITDNVSKLWNNDYSVKLGGTFSTQWLVNCELPFSHVKNLTNPLNNHEPVIKSRDTQELPKEIGIQLCHMCYDMQESSRRNIYDVEKINKIIEENKKHRESKINLLKGFFLRTMLLLMLDRYLLSQQFVITNLN